MLQLWAKELNYMKCRGLQIVSIVFCNSNFISRDYVQPYEILLWGPGHMILIAMWVCSLNLVHAIIPHRPNLNSQDVHCFRETNESAFKY